MVKVVVTQIFMLTASYIGYKIIPDYFRESDSTKKVIDLWAGGARVISYLSQYHQFGIP